MSPRQTTRRNQLIPASAVIILLLAIAFYANGSFSQPPQRTATGAATVSGPESQTTTLPAGGQTGEQPFRLYFTDPFAPGAGNYTGGPDEAIVEAIDAARQSIDIAIYNFNLDNVAQALLRAKSRGVRVRIAMESDALDGRVPQALLEQGIPIVGDQREGLMHDKFMVIDGYAVWTGSLNFTETGTYNDYNQIVEVNNTKLAQDYTSEFEEMFVDGQFGPNGTANTPYPNVTVDGYRVQVYFSPDDGVAEHLVDLINGAQKSVHFLAYSFTANDLSQAMLARAKAGVDVRGVFEAAQVKSNQGTEFPNLQKAGLDVREDTLAGQMHMKVIIVDGEVVSFGSYNFSASAENSNDENVMIVQDPALAGQFEQEFERIFSESAR